MMRLRGFEHVSGYETAGLPLPARSTPGSAGYDFVAAESVCLPAGERALIPTGVKAYMLQDEYLGIHIRSSLAVVLDLSGIAPAEWVLSALSLSVSFFF